MSQVTFYSQKSRAILEAARRPEESVADLVGRMEEDAYVLLAKRTIRAKVTEADVTVSTTSNDIKARILAATFDEVWKAHVGQMLECFGYGRAAFEIVKCAVGAGPNLTHAVLRLEPLPYPETEPLFSEDGKQAGMADGVKLGGGETPLELPKGDGWWLALDATSLNPYGQSRYKGAPEVVWRRRCTALERLDTFNHHYSIPKLVIFAPLTRKGPNGEDINVHDEVGGAAQGSRAGDVIIFPNEYDQLPDGTYQPRYKYSEEQIGARDGTPLLAQCESLGSELLLALGVPPKTLIEGDAVGSFAMVSEQTKNLFAMIEEVLSQIVKSFQDCVIDPVVEYNFAGAKPAITCAFVPITQRPDDLAVELVKAWLTTPALSPLVTGGQVDVAKMLEMVGIPTQSATKAATWVQQQSPPGLPGPIQMAAPLSPSFRHLMRG